MPTGNWGEVLDAMRGLDSKIATPIKTAMACIEELMEAEGALNQTRRRLGEAQQEAARAKTDLDSILAVSVQAQEQARAEIARCQASMAQAQADEQAALMRGAETAARITRDADAQAKALAEEYAAQAAALQAELVALRSTRDALAAEIADLRRRVGAL